MYFNENQFRQIMSCVKSEIDRQKQQELSIRKLINAREHQSTVEALMDVVLALRPQMKLQAEF
jgi:hypothetical protein